MSNNKDQSVLLDNDGNKLVFYHGTRSIFTRFIPSKSGAQGAGIYMTDEPSIYGDFIMKLHVNMVNPFYFYPTEDSLEAPINGELLEQVLGLAACQDLEALMMAEGSDKFTTQVQDALKDQGHDGIVMVYPFGEPKIPGLSGSAVVIAFDPDQIEILSEPSTTKKPRRSRELSEASPGF